MDVSDVKFICPKCGKAVRLGYKIISNKVGEKAKKYRICKKCKSEV